jgi:hypothetical protein
MEPVWYAGAIGGPPGRTMLRSNDSRPVGIGENVFVSVSNPAVKIRRERSFNAVPRCSIYWRDVLYFTWSFRRNLRRSDWPIVQARRKHRPVGMGERSSA